MDKRRRRTLYTLLVIGIAALCTGLILLFTYSGWSWTGKGKKMTDSTEMFPIQRITKDGKHDTEDLVTKELPLTIILNNQELATLLCSPTDLNYLAIGFLASEGLLKSKDEVKKIMVDEQRGVVRVETKEDKERAS